MTNFNALARKATGSILSGALLLGGFLGGAPRAFAASGPGSADNVSTVSNAQVTQQDVVSLFDDVLVDKFNAWKNRKSFNTEDNLSQKFSQAQTNKQQALILAFSAMGGVQHVTNLANQKIDVWGRPEDADRDYDPIPLRYGREETSRAIWDAAKADSDSTMPNGNIKFVQLVAKSANTLLEGARDHKMEFSDYMVKIYIPYNGPLRNDPGLIAIQQTARSFGLANRTIAMNIEPK